MLKQRNYWVYSIGCFVVWGIILALAAAKAKNGTFDNVLLVFAGGPSVGCRRRSPGSYIHHPSDGYNGANHRCSRSTPGCRTLQGDRLPHSGLGCISRRSLSAQIGRTDEHWRP